jgi:hypothetical protein
MDPQTHKTTNQQANAHLTVTATPATGTPATGTSATGTSVTGTPARGTSATDAPSTASTSTTHPKWWQTAPPRDSLLSFIFNWTCTVLTVAASLVFGIWAPLSYQATINSNSGSTAAQSSAVSAASLANDLALTAQNIASAAYAEAAVQGSALADVQTRIGAVGQLVLIEFCATQTVSWLSRTCSSLSKVTL